MNRILAWLERRHRRNTIRYTTRHPKPAVTTKRTTPTNGAIALITSAEGRRHRVEPGPGRPERLFHAEEPADATKPAVTTKRTTP